MTLKRLFIVLFVTLLVGCGTEGNEPVEEEKVNEETDEAGKNEVAIETPEDDRLQFGESAEIDGVKVTINDAEFTDERIPDHFETFEYVLKLDVTYENTTDTVFPAGRDIVVKKNDEDTTYYDMEGILLEDIPAGDKASGPLYFAFNGQPEELTAIFSPLLNDDGDSAEFNVMPRD